MDEITEYITIYGWLDDQDPSYLELDAAVNDFIIDGWQPFGSIIQVRNKIFAQPMIKKETKW